VRLKQGQKHYMIRYKEIQTAHIELTNRCQASCPMCDRNFHGGLENSRINIADWTIEQFVNVFDRTEIEHFYLCGNFGDPMICKDILPILQYLKNKQKSVEVHTNGGMHTPVWWSALASCLPKKHKVVFSIDGLQNTHHLYRIGTEYQRVLSHAKHFIKNGGNAVWSFLAFKHNEHEIQEAKSLAKAYGFIDFYLKHSSRFSFDNKFGVLDKNLEFQYFLQPSSQAQLTKLTDSELSNIQDFVDSTDISCHAQHSKEIYIDAHKKLFPCCFLASIPYQPYENEKLHDIRLHIEDQYAELIQDLGNTNVLEKSIKSIVESEPYQTVWNKYWTVKKLYTCARTCGNKLQSPSEQISNANKATV